MILCTESKFLREISADVVDQICLLNVLLALEKVLSPIQEFIHVQLVDPIALHQESSVEDAQVCFGVL